MNCIYIIYNRHIIIVVHYELQFRIELNNPKMFRFFL